MSPIFNNSGASNLYSLSDLPQIPLVLSEWFAVIPLVCHLATYKHDWELLGHISLNGFISISIFPRLGTLAGLARFLSRGSDFIDEANSQGRPAWRVWDVRWGGSFPCANGCASAMLVEYAMKKCKSCVVDAPSELLDKQPFPAAQDSKPILSTSSSERTIVALETTSISASKSMGSQVCDIRTDEIAIHEREKSVRTDNKKLVKGHRRYQTLHHIQFSRRPVNKTWRLRVRGLLDSTICTSLYIFLKMLFVVLLVILGLFGTSGVILGSAVSQVACRMVSIERPPGYLISNETKGESCMLVALHENASSWYLFHGDRGTIDNLLNKTMVSVTQSRKSTIACWILRITHATQILAMTLVAGSKGWDGIASITLMLIDFFVSWQSARGHTARLWQEVEGVDICAKSYRFTGRTMLIGAVHSLSGSRNDAWMNDILAPVPRRETWLARLRGLEADSKDDAIVDNGDGVWSEHDWKSIVLTSELAFRSAEVIRNGIERTKGV